MPCFSSGPTPGTPEYDEWLPKVRAELDAFIHVVDYYYGKAGIPVPELVSPDASLGFPNAKDLALSAAQPIDSDENARVLHQILLHLDCDDVGMLQLHDLRLLLHADPASKGHRYAAVLAHCFGVMRVGFRERPANEAQWRACQSPWHMLDSLQRRVSDRKLRLYAVACARRLSHVLADERCQNAIDVAERFADGHAEGAELTAAQDATKDLSNRRGTGSSATWAVSSDADGAARMTAMYSSVDSDAGREEEEAAQAALLRCVVGNNFRPVTFSPMWRTDTSLALAQQIYDTTDFSVLPILADALQDAGCDSEDVLAHCRGPGPHVRGCWVVDLVLGKQ